MQVAGRDQQWKCPGSVETSGIPKIVAAWLQVMNPLEQHMEYGGVKVRAVVGRVTALWVASHSWHTEGNPVQRRDSHVNQTGETEAAP